MQIAVNKQTVEAAARRRVRNRERMGAMPPPLVISLIIPILLTAQVLAAPTAKSPSQLLTEAKSEITASHSYKADGLLQQVVKSEDAQRAQVEEALVLQGMIYYGDVFASALVLPSLVAVANKPEPFGRKVSERLVLASRAFHSSITKYLNITAPGAKLTKLQVALPDFDDEGVKKLQDALSDRETVEALLAGYSSDPSGGEGMYSRASQFGLYLGFGGSLPKQKGRKLTDIRAKLGGGVPFDHLRYLDWAASVSLDMSKQVKDTMPEFDLKQLAKRCDERLLKVAPADSQWAKNAKARLGNK